MQKIKLGKTNGRRGSACLHRLGVVSNEELMMQASIKGTPGLDLIHAIKARGKAYVKLNDYQGLMGVKEKDRG